MFNTARLRSCLPQMVIDILEDKMEHEYRNGALSLLQHINNSTQILCKDDDDDDDDDDAGCGLVGNPIVS